MLGEAVALLRRCPDLAKAILAAGLLVSALSVGGPLVLNEVKSDVWGVRMTTNSARLNVVTGIVSIVFGGIFGRLTDRMSKRKGMALVGLVNFLPWYALLTLGANQVGLNAYCMAVVCSGITCMTPTGCPMIFAFANEVMDPKDQEVGFGIAFAGAFVIALFSSLGGMVVAKFFPGEAMPILLYIAFLSLSFFLVLPTIKLRVPEPEVPLLDEVFCGVDDAAASDGSEDNYDPAEANKPRIYNLPEQDPKEVVSESAESSDSEFGHKRAAVCSLLASMRLSWEYAPLRNLCLTTALLCLPEVGLGDVTNQFIYSTLNLESARKQQQASQLNDYPGLLSTLPAYLLMGRLSKSCGALRLLKLMIPVAALLQVLPIALVQFKAMWFVPILGISMKLSGVIFTPLQIVNAQIAPEGRVGECMASVGVAKQAASVASNLLVSSITPWLRERIARPEPFYFPVAGIICLLAYIPAVFIRIPSKPSDGEDSEPSEEAS